VGIVTGVLLGTLYMASHSAQGPHLGLPQMIQSRAQFGYYGAAFPLAFAVLMYPGFSAAGVVLGARTLAELTGLSIGPGIVVLSVLSTLVAIFGYAVPGGDASARHRLGIVRQRHRAPRGGSVTEEYRPVGVAEQQR
jgi:purine-cytosine permease-like protein